MCIGIVYTLHIAHSQLLFVKGSRHRILMQCRFHRCCSPSFCWVQLRGAVAPSLGVSSFSEKSRRSEENSIEVKTWRQDWGHLSNSFGRHHLDCHFFHIFLYIHLLFTIANWSSCRCWLQERHHGLSGIIQHRSSSILQWMDVLNWKQLWRSASAVSFGPTKLAMLAATSACSCGCWHQKGELAATDLMYKASCLNHMALAPPLHSVSASDDVVSQSIRWQWSEHWDGLRRLRTKRELTELSHSYTK